MSSNHDPAAPAVAFVGSVEQPAKPPRHRKLFWHLGWAIVAVLAVIVHGPGFLRSFVPEQRAGGLPAMHDFFQEWASARNLIEGLPVYTNQEITVERYLGWRRGGSQPFFIEYSSRPPVLVVLIVPLAYLDYPSAFLIWNLISLLALATSVALIASALGLRLSFAYALPAITLLLICNPLRIEIANGQLNSVLLLLITGVWLSARSERWAGAGVLLAVATSVKLFPGFLLLYFLMQRQWRLIGAALASGVALNAMALAVVGPGAYQDYWTKSLPFLAPYRGSWLNASVAGFWTRLFDAQAIPEQVQSLYHSPALAWVAIAISSSTLTLLTAWAAWRARNRAARDLAFALSLVAMLLVSPTTWDHYFLLLVLPFVLLVKELQIGDDAGFWLPLTMSAFVAPLIQVGGWWIFALTLLPFEALTVRSPGLGLRGWGLRLILTCLWPHVFMFTYLFTGLHGFSRYRVQATPLDSVTGLAVPFYALLALFVTLLVLAGRAGRRGCISVSGRDSLVG